MPSTKLKCSTLTAIVVGSMLGGGFFNLPQNLACSAGAAAMTVSWLITACGIFFLTENYHTLYEQDPEADNGLYGYIQKGFGDFLACFAVWGYWCSCWIGNLAYLLLIAGAVSFFFPSAEGLLVTSGLLWITHMITLKGIHVLSYINSAMTCLKLMMLALCLLLLGYGFDWQIFVKNSVTPHEKNFLTQITESLLVTAWCFVGFEGAIILAERAKRREEVTRAIRGGILITLGLYLMISLLPLGLLNQNALSQLPSPAMGALLESLIGPWGGGLLAAGVLLFGLGALCAWTLFAIELPFLAARGGVFPAFFAQSSPAGVPTTALWITTSIIQAMLFAVYGFSMNYLLLINSATMAILPLYALSTAYALTRPKRPLQESLRTLLGLTYLTWLLYSCCELLPHATALIFGPGACVAYWTTRKRATGLFS